MFTSTRNIIGNCFQRRCFHVSQLKRLNSKEVEEVKIPVPWGHVSGKWWGSTNSQPIIAIHGYLDNANSFDKLLPLLQTKSVLCIDLPGHGHSSHLPKGMSINYMDYIIYLRYIITQHYKWKNISLLGHSFGSSICFVYAGLFPKDTKQMINIECSRFGTAINDDRFIDELRSSIEGFTKVDIEKKLPSKGHTWEEIVSYLFKMRAILGVPLSKESCEIIAKRGTVQLIDNSYRFSHDGRLKFRSLVRCHNTFNFAIAGMISSSVLNIEANDGYAFCNTNEKNKLKEEIRQNSERFVDVTIDGSHHVHLENPNNLADAINDFWLSEPN